VVYDDVSSAKNFPGTEFPEKATTGNLGMKQMPAEVTYEEGIYVGYRYTNTFNIKPAYEFGYGLSYTSFKYGQLQVSSGTFTKNITATITITNTGKAAGREAVQLYLAAPKGRLDKPTEELKAFAKTGLLQPGESETVRFTLKAADLASFDTEAGAWVADGGTYTIKIGASSLNIKQSASFKLTKAILVETCNRVLVPKQPVNELKK
jgi:beta-glucosidase